MARLIDWVRHQPLISVSEIEEHVVRNMVDAAGECEAMVMDDVAVQFYELMDGPGLDIPTQPNIQPPFPVTWCEMKRPERVVLEGEEIPWEGPAEWGFMFFSWDLEKDDKMELNGQHRSWMEKGLRWLVSGWLFVRDPFQMEWGGSPNLAGEQKQWARGPLAQVRLPINRDGHFMDGHLAMEGTVKTKVYGVSRERHRAAADSVVALVEPILLGLSIANCSNVSLPHQEPSNRERKRWERRTEGKPLMSYRVLEIGYGEKRGRGAVRGETGDGQGVALHVCRGHMRTYTEDAPLFGKHVGSFWVPAHLRGQKDQGVVVKDYKVRGEVDEPAQDG